MHSLPKVFRYLAEVLVQDALDLADLYPTNPVYRTLLDDDGEDGFK